MTTPYKSEIEFAGHKLSLEAGKIAGKAQASVLARYGDTVVLATVCTKEGLPDVDFFPLTVDYEEKLYAGGRFPTSRFIKREGRPSEEAILTARLIDRSIRPLFPKDQFFEVQVIITVLSVDQENDPALLAVIAASAALTISDLPWNGPVTAVRVGSKDSELVLNPTESELEFLDLDLVVTVNREAPIMIEAQGKEVDEKIIISAIKFAQKEAEPIFSLISDLAKKAGAKKKVLEKEKEDPKLLKTLEKEAQGKIRPLLSGDESLSDESNIAQLKEEIYQDFADKLKKATISQIVEKIFRQAVREKILQEGKRPDGRLFDQVRPLEVEVGILPRTHGSALFQRGETQVLSIVTLGSPALEQLIEGMMGADTKRFMHHYNFPPYSTGEVKRVGSPGRREVGHGALAEKAIQPVIPAEEIFPYAIRVVSEITSSNGSTSMAAVCGSTLALMDAGVPIKEPIAGIAIGLISENGKHQLLTDIAGLEDGWGDMDFKVAGTEKGVTAIQLDVKIPGVKTVILEEALEMAKKSRIFILSKMLEVLPHFREKISPYAPKIKILKIDPAKIGEVIGSKGTVIKNIQSQTDTVADIEEDGTITISGKDDQSIAKAVSWIESIVKEVKPGEVYDGTVKRIFPFGAMVEIFPGKEGLIHKNELASLSFRRIEDVLKIGQRVRVRVAEIDNQGRVNFSMREQGEPSRPSAFQKGFNPKIKRFRR